MTQTSYKRNPGQERARRDLLTTGKRFPLIYGGSRCVAGGTVLDGHTKTIRQLAIEGLPVMVRTSHGYQMAEAPFRKGRDTLMRFEMEDGRHVEVTDDHRFWNGSVWIKACLLFVGDFVALVPSFSQSLRPSILGAGLSVSPQDAGHSLKTPQGFQGRCFSRSRQCDEQLLSVQSSDQVFRASQSYGSGHNLWHRRDVAPGSDSHEALAPKPGATHSQTYQASPPQSKTDGFQVTGRDGQLTDYGGEHTCELSLQKHSTHRQFQSPSSHRGSSHQVDHIAGDQCAPLFVSSDVPLAGGYKLCRVKSITRTAKQDYYTLHVPGCEHYFANGILHHNSGKTFEFVGTVIERALIAPKSRHLIVRQEATSAKRAIVKGTWPEVMAARWPGLGWEWKEQYGYFALENGSEVWVGGLNDEAALEKILGTEYSTIYMNEASEVRYSAFTLLRSRLAQQVQTIKGDMLSQRFYVDLNPTNSAHWTYKLWIEGVDPVGGGLIDRTDFGHITINPMDNAANLSPEYLKDLQALPELARKRFFDGVYGADAPNALWRRSYIKRTQDLPDMVRVVVAIDPAVSSEVGSDETGIVVAGLGKDGCGYILADESGKFRPEEWARRAISAYATYDADRIIGEVNQGGAMVESVIRAQAQNVSYSAVTATRGKVTRAEPIAALYERGKVFHAGEFEDLEAQMCSFTTGFDSKKAGYSPDRVDALVWALTALFPAMVAKQQPVHIPPPRVNMPMARR